MAKIGRGVGCRVRRGFPFTTAGCDRKEAVKAECYHRALLQILGDFQTETEKTKKYFVYNVHVHVVRMCGRGTISNTFFYTQTEKKVKKKNS